MTAAFGKMKKSRMGFQDLADKLEGDKQGGTKFKKDERFYYPERDKAGNGFAIIRFLPAPDGETLPWVKTMSHGFQDVGGWFIDECPTVLDKPCPVCEANSKIVTENGGWDACPESIKTLIRKRKRKISYVANIVVVQDKKHPEYERKNFLFKFGVKIFDKITSATAPEFEDETPINPFDFWEGANFKLKIVKKDGMVNYDKSEFEDVSQLAKTDAAMEKVWKQEYSLLEFVAGDKFKSYEALIKRLGQVLGENVAVASTAAEVTSVPDFSAKATDEEVTSAPEETEPAEETEAPAAVAEGEEDDPLAYFRNMAETA